MSRKKSEVKPDAEGKIFSPATGLFLAVREEWLRWLTTEGELIPTPQELDQQEHQQAEAEHQQAEAEHQRAERAEQSLEAYQRRFGSLE